jgi:hypothetical protein
VQPRGGSRSDEAADVVHDLPQGGTLRGDFLPDERYVGAALQRALQRQVARAAARDVTVQDEFEIKVEFEI